MCSLKPAHEAGHAIVLAIVLAAVVACSATPVIRGAADGPTPAQDSRPTPALPPPGAGATDASRAFQVEATPSQAGPEAGDARPTADAHLVADLPALYAFDLPSQRVGASPRLVIAHWHQFPVSQDNLDPQHDLFARAINDGVITRNASLRYRTLPRPVRPQPDWLVRDAMADIRWAEALGVDGFLMNFSPADTTNPNGYPAFVRYLQAAEELGSGFRIGPNIGCGGCDAPGYLEANPPGKVAAQIISFLDKARLRQSNALLRTYGKVLMGSFAAERAPRAGGQSSKISYVLRAWTPISCASSTDGAMTGSTNTMPPATPGATGARAIRFELNVTTSSSGRGCAMSR